jgi:dipeptidyl aminopeptidase/acylaminoacyl peptidase
MEHTGKKIHISDIVLFIVFLALLALPAYLAYQVLVAKNKPTDTKTDVNQTETSTTEGVDPYPDKYEPTGPKYVEMVREIEGQTAYVAVPASIDEKNPPAIVMYSHGSNTRVISDMYDPFMIDLQGYGKYFGEQNYIFAASNEHDENWGNAASIADMLNLQQWIQSHYTTSNKMYLIGFSMGGLPTMHFAVKYPENIQKIALLAPTTRTYEWTQDSVSKIMNIEIQIWHGTSDVNIGYSNSANFVKYMKNLGKDIPLITLEGKSHFDLDTEYMDQVFQFFQAN